MRLSVSCCSFFRLCGLMLSLVGVELVSVEPVQVIVRAEVRVSADHATLADVAELRGDQEIISVLADLPIVELPDLSVKTIDGLVITKAIGRSLGDRFRVQGSGTVVRQALSIDEATLAKAAESVITLDDDEVKISVLRHSGAVAIPAGGSEHTFVVDALDKQLIGDIPVRVRVLRGEREFARALITLRVERARTVVVAARALRRGDVLTPGDLRLKCMALTSRFSSGIKDIATLVGQEVRLEVEEGSPLQLNLVSLPPAVRAGQTIELVVTNKHFHVSGSAVALGSGAIGDVINVRRQADGHTVRARIEGLGVVTFER